MFISEREHITMFKIFIRTALILVLAHGLGTFALAQGTTGSVLGVVYDQSQAVLPGVEITATNTATGLTRSTLSDDQGRYVLAQLRVGPYSIQAELPGFQTSFREVTLTLQGDMVVDHTLTVGAAGTEIVVTGEAPLVETTSSSLVGLVDRPNLIPGGNNNPVLHGGRNPDEYFDYTQFEPAPPGIPGQPGSRNH
jgi:hypothetical protein